MRSVRRTETDYCIMVEQVDETVKA